MSRWRLALRPAWLCCLLSSCAASIAGGCGSPLTIPDGSAGEDGGPAPSDASTDAEPVDRPDGDVVADAGPIDPLDAGAVDPADAGPLDLMDAGPIDPVDAGPGTNPAFEAEMTYTTANIGRDYGARAEVAAAIDRVADAIGARAGPRLIGWQEIGEGDPCGTCEIEALRARLTTAAGWVTLHPNGTRPDGGTERVKVPVTSKGANTGIAARAVFASPGWAGVSPTRFVTVVHAPQRNLSIVNTHFIAGAWSCRSEVARRRDYWRRAWAVLQDQVAIEHRRGRNVIVTGDLNRPRATNSCNPAWDPTSLHPASRVVGGEGIDYVFAVPAAGWTFALSRRADGTAQRGSIRIGIDGHQAHWVTGQFRGP